LYGTIAKPLPDAAVGRVYHVRSGRKKMATKFEWRDVDGSKFNPDKDDSPFEGVVGSDPVANKGDGTVPYWSARLPQTPASNVFDCEYAWDHGTLLEHKEVLTHVHGLIEKGSFAAPAGPAMEVPPIERATLAEAEAWVEQVKAGEIKLGDERATDPRVWRRIIEEITP
jgi:hypothetical protein